MTTATTLRLDGNDKAEATEILKSMGVSLNGYLNMAVKQLINQRKIPFEIVPAADVPTEETRLAMLMAEAKSAGVVPDGSPGYTDVDEFVDALEA